MARGHIALEFKNGKLSLQIVTGGLSGSTSKRPEKVLASAPLTNEDVESIITTFNQCVKIKEATQDDQC